MQVPTVVRSCAQALVLVVSGAALAAAQTGSARVAGYTPAPEARAPWSGAHAAGRAEPLVTLRLDAVPLEEALIEVAREARIQLTYSNEALPAGRRVTARLHAVPVTHAFARVLEGTDLQAVPSRVDRMTIVRRTPPEPVAPAPEAASPALAGGITIMAPEADGSLVGTIRGRVTEAGSGRPIAGAQVLVVGTPRGAVTSAGGEYALAGVAAGPHTLRARIIGFQPVERTVEVGDGQTVTADFSLTPAALQLDAVVVTGTPGAVSQRTLGNSVATINVAEVSQRVVNTTVAELLQGKAPGVTVLQSSGTPGAASNIRIRGIGSLSASSEPVIYVDGVRIHSGAGGAFRNNWETPAQGQTAGGGQTASSLDAINPEDIESIEVIRGPAAATLYGADAANGVIQIITRRGRPGDQKLQWNARFQLGQTAWGLDRRTSLTTCDNVRIAQPAPHAVHRSRRWVPRQ
jgi:TonB-dependent SusC/RagA subfamily outer membrane receptor